MPRRRIPIYVGAVNQRMMQAAGQWADGVELGAMVSPGYLRWSWAQICEGAEAAGRDPATLDLASNVLVSVDRDARAARDAVRRVLAYYTARVEPIVLSTSGADPDELAAVQHAVAERGVAAGAEVVTDAMIDTFAAAGDIDQVAARLTVFAEAGLRGLNAWHVLGPEPQAALVVFARDVHDRVVAS